MFWTDTLTVPSEIGPFHLCLLSHIVLIHQRHKSLKYQEILNLILSKKIEQIIENRTEMNTTRGPYISKS